MSEEAKTGTSDAVALASVTPSVPRGHVHADTLQKVSKFDQSKDAIPKVVPPRGSKDARSFRPSTLAEINMMNRYEPLTMQACGRTIPIGCGNSLEDVLLICGCIFALWSFVLGLAALMLKSAIDTDRYIKLDSLLLSTAAAAAAASSSGSSSSSQQQHANTTIIVLCCTLTFWASTYHTHVYRGFAFSRWTRELGGV